jgi:hypothetical protein
MSESQDAPSFEEYIRSKIAEAQAVRDNELRMFYAPDFVGFLTPTEIKLLEELYCLQNENNERVKLRKTKETAFKDFLITKCGKHFPKFPEPGYDAFDENFKAFNRVQELVKGKFNISAVRRFTNTQQPYYLSFTLVRIPNTEFDVTKLFKDVIIEAWDNFRLVSSSDGAKSVEFQHTLF